MSEHSNSNGSVSANPENPVSTPLPNSRKVYLAGELHPDLRVPFREISLAPTKTMSGEIEVNDPVRVYDTSGPWGDADQHVEVEQGLPPLRADWIRARGDVEEIEGRAVAPIDDGYLSVSHAESSAKRNGSRKYEGENRKLGRKPLRAKPSSCVTQLAYARRGIITPEMEFIALRENSGLTSDFRPPTSDFARNDLGHQHAGNSFGAAIPKEITPEFVRAEVARG
ncbi:MAG: phosphomethylpyrimidine synthase, partial [Verrucomicrobiota bacterium]